MACDSTTIAAINANAAATPVARAYHVDLALRAPGGTESVLGVHADDSRAVLFGTAEARRTGDWAIVWQVLSLDGHVTRGEIPFRVEDAPLK
jgi:hypothetical protein